MIKLTFFMLMLLAFAFGLLSSVVVGKSSIPESVLALVGVCATFIVGIHVVDAIKLRELESKINIFNSMQNEIKDMRRNANVALHISWAMSYWNRKPKSACVELWKAFRLALENEDVLRANTCLELLEKFIKEKRYEVNTHSLSNDMKEIEEFTYYKVFKSRIQTILNQKNQKS